jgi:hypothetical protein
MVFELFKMSILIRWCYKWMSQMFSTPFQRESSFKNFKWQEVNCFNFPPLFGLFMPNRFPFSLATIPPWEIC